MSKITQEKKRKKLQTKLNQIGLNVSADNLLHFQQSSDYQLALSWYGQDIANWLIVQIKNTMDEFEFSDNLRFFEDGNEMQIQHANEIASNGCCGLHEEIIHHPTGRIFNIAFNYGH